MPVPIPDLRLPSRGASWKWWVCGLLLLATMLNYMDRLTLNLTAKRIMEEFDFQELKYGYLEKYFGYAFALGAIVFGWMVDRWSIRWIYPAVVLAWSAAGFATGMVNGFMGLLICRFLLGFCEAGHWPCALRTTQHILPPSERSMGNSLLQSGAAFGAILTPMIVMGMIAWTGSWRYSFLAIGAIGVGWVVIWLMNLRREDLSAANSKPSSSLTSVLIVLIALLALDGSIHVWYHDDPWLPLVTAVGVTTVGIGYVFWWLMNATRDDTRLPRGVFRRRFCVLILLVTSINLTWHYLRAWLPLFLQVRHGYDETTKDWFMTAYYIVADVGCLSVGFITLQLVQRGIPVHWSRLIVFGICALLTTSTIVVAILPKSWALLAVLLVLGFAALGLFPNYYSFSQEITVQYQGKVTGALGCINWLAMALLHELVGDSIKRTGSYTIAMALAGLPPLLGVLAMLLLWGDTQPQSDIPEEPVPTGTEEPAAVEEHLQAPSQILEGGPPSSRLG